MRDLGQLLAGQVSVRPSAALAPDFFAPAMVDDQVEPVAGSEAQGYVARTKRPFGGRRDEAERAAQFQQGRRRQVPALGNEEGLAERQGGRGAEVPDKRRCRGRRARRAGADDLLAERTQDGFQSLMTM